MILTEAVLVFFLSWTLDKFLIPRVLHFQKIILYKCSGILEHIWRSSFIVKRLVVCSVYSKNREHYENRLLQKILFFRGSRSQMLIKKVFFKNFFKFTGKHHRSLHLMKLLAEKETPTRMFSCNFYDIFKKTLFLEARGDIVLSVEISLEATI